jgi:hypothetical protein
MFQFGNPDTLVFPDSSENHAGELRIGLLACWWLRISQKDPRCWWKRCQHILATPLWTRSSVAKVHYGMHGDLLGMQDKCPSRLPRWSPTSRMDLHSLHQLMHLWSLSLQDDGGPLGARGQARSESLMEVGLDRGGQRSYHCRRSHYDIGLRDRWSGRGHMSTDDWLGMEIFVNHESPKWPRDYAKL